MTLLGHSELNDVHVSRTVDKMQLTVHGMGAWNEIRTDCLYNNDDVKTLPHYRHFVWEIHRSPMDFPQIHLEKGQ